MRASTTYVLTAILLCLVPFFPFFSSPFFSSFSFPLFFPPSSRYIEERITLAAEVIVDHALDKIDEEGDVLLTFGRSFVIEQVRERARKREREREREIEGGKERNTHDLSSRDTLILTSLARLSIVVRSLFAPSPTPSSSLFFTVLLRRLSSHPTLAAAEGQGSGASIPGHHRRCTAEPGGEGAGGHTGCGGD